LDEAEKSPGELRYWAQTIDGVVYACWYRLRGDDQIEVFARGHRVVVPLAIALLPESVARAVLAQLRPPAAASPNQHEDDAGVLQPPSSDAAEPSNG
jgi:hypothetical protein